MSIPIELEQEDDGRWIAEVPDLPGVLAYGATREEAMEAVRALAIRVLAERSDSHLPVSDSGNCTAGIDDRSLIGEIDPIRVRS